MQKLIILLALAFCLSACSNPTESPDTNQSPIEAGTVTIYGGDEPHVHTAGYSVEEAVTAWVTDWQQVNNAELMPGAFQSP